MKSPIEVTLTQGTTGWYRVKRIKRAIFVTADDAKKVPIRVGDSINEADAVILTTLPQYQVTVEARK